jgi:hypothetical protein
MVGWRRPRTPTPPTVNTNPEPGAWIPERGSRAAALAVSALAAVAIAAWTYAPSRSSYLITDDFQWLAGAISSSWESIVSIAGRSHFYRPAVDVHFKTMYALAGCSAEALHLASVAVHLVNVVLVLALAHALTARVGLAAVAALLFAAQPAPAHAVLWPSAISALLSTAFGLAMLLLGHRQRSGGGPLPMTIAFAAALAAHESAVMLLPTALVLRMATGDRPAFRWVREYVPALLVLLAYLVLTAWINSRNYVVTDGRYGVGWHIATNLLQYLVALWAGRRNPVDAVATLAVLALVVWRGRPMTRAWVAWIVAALLPMLPFIGETASRYTYLASVPFSLLLAVGVIALHDLLHDRARSMPLAGPRAPVAAIAVAVIVTSFLVVRSVTFTRKGVAGFHADATPFAELARTLRSQPGPNKVVDAAAVSWLDAQYRLPLAHVAECSANVTIEER